MSSEGRPVLSNIERYGIAGKAAGEAVVEHGRDGARLRPAADAFLLSRIARAVVDALDDHDRGAVDALDEAIKAARLFNRSGMTWLEYDALLVRLENVVNHARGQ